MQQVRIKDLKTGADRRVDADGVLIAVGWDPNTAIFGGQLDMDDDGYLKTEGVKTNKQGIYVVGDLVDREYRQVVTSCGSGCAAALEAIRWIEGQQGK